MSEQGDVLQPTSPAERDKAPSRVIIPDCELSTLTSAEWLNRWRQQESYVTSLERKISQQEGELMELRQTTDRIKGQLHDSQQKEKVLVRRLAAKEQETQEYVCQLSELKTTQAPNMTSLRSALLDPAVNSLLQQLRTELQATRLKLEDTQNELSAWKFTPDSNTGKRLMAKCRLLYQENEELGKITSSGRIAKLESDLALQKSFSEEVRQSQNELDSFLADLDEDVEGMQSTILFLQTELKKAKDALATAQQQAATARAQPELTIVQQQKDNCSSVLKQNLGLGNGRANGDASLTNNSTSGVCFGDEQDMLRTDSDESEVERTRGAKRIRRSSVLSIDYNDDDALVINANGDVAMSSDAE